MSTISKALAEELIANNGQYKDDPKAHAVLVYLNPFDNSNTYAVVYNEGALQAYIEAHMCRIIWPLASFYFTFPQRSSFRNGYMKIVAPSMKDARNAMLMEYGEPIFAFSYDEADFLPQIEKYKLYEIPFGYMPD